MVDERVKLKNPNTVEQIPSTLALIKNITSQHVSELEQYIHKFFGVDKNALEQIAQFFTPTEFKKGDFFSKKGRYCNQLGFIQSGIIREYLEVNGKEVTKWISSQGYFVVDLSSFIFRKEGRWNIQALTDCEIYVINIDQYRKIGKVIPDWKELEKLFIAKCFGTLEQRIVQHLAMSAEERYNQLYNLNKELFNLVPLQYLASMLGMTPETLSRIRKKAMDVNS